jgi:hypothetical protein
LRLDVPGEAGHDEQAISSAFGDAMRALEAALLLHEGLVGPPLIAIPDEAPTEIDLDESLRRRHFFKRYVRHSLCQHLSTVLVRIVGKALLFDGEFFLDLDEGLLGLCMQLLVLT